MTKRNPQVILFNVNNCKCPVCFGTEWIVDDSKFSIIEEQKIPYDDIYGIRVVAVMCPDCGYIRLHSSKVWKEMLEMKE